MAIDVRISQAVREIALALNPDARVSQVVREVALQLNPHARVSQVVREVTVSIANDQLFFFGAD